MDFEIRLYDYLPACQFDGDCNDSGDPENDCADCSMRREGGEYHIPCVLTVKDSQMTFTFPEHQDNYLRVTPVTLNSAATITMPRIPA